MSKEKIGRLLLEASHGLLGESAKALADAWCDMARKNEELQSRLEQTEKDAARFKKLASHMQFQQDGAYVTMDFVCPLDATKTHDLDSDFAEPAFTESVRRTVDAEIKS